MRVGVRFFSYLADLIGAQQVELDLPAAATIADLSRRLQEMYPARAAMLAQAVFIVDRKHATPEMGLADGAHVLVLLSLGGG
jgi:molybdopterin converting factor small subunit